MERLSGDMLSLSVAIGTKQLSPLIDLSGMIRLPLDSGHSAQPAQQADSFQPCQDRCTHTDTRSSTHAHTHVCIYMRSTYTHICTCRSYTDSVHTCTHVHIHLCSCMHNLLRVGPGLHFVTMATYLNREAHHLGDRQCPHLTIIFSFLP